jgi:hypothetical protein
MRGDLPRGPLSYSGLWCGEAALEAFGITRRGQARTCWGAVVTTLGAGRTLTRVLARWDQPVSLGRFVAEHPEGDWLISTADHVMALRGGQLTDTDLAAGGRRRVLEAWQVT